jgi:transposase
MQQALPASPSLPAKLWAMDETRVGLHTVRRRRLTLRGVKPVGVHQHRFENVYVYGAIAPASGESWFGISADMSSARFQQFLDQFAAAHADTLNVLLLDNSRTHHASTLVLPENVVLLFQPAYAPEVNPAERVWQALKDALAWERFARLGSLVEHVMAVVGEWTEEMLASLTSYPYIMSALTAQSS